MNIKLIIIAILFIGVSKLSSQAQEYLNGYVIFEQGDLHFTANLQSFSAIESCKKVEFKDSLERVFKAKKKEVKAYKRGEENYFSKRYNNGTSLLPTKPTHKTCASGVN